MLILRLQQEILRLQEFEHEVSDTSDAEDTFSHNVNMLIQEAEYVNSDDDADYVPSGSEDDDDEDYADMPDLEYDLTGLKFSDYGKGYLLRPSRSTTFTGVKYLNNGWWNQSQGGWFFRKQYFDDLLEAGATYRTGSTSSDSSRSSRLSTRSNATNGTNASSSSRVGPSPFETERDPSGFTIEPYGRGVILIVHGQILLFSRRLLIFWEISDGGIMLNKDGSFRISMCQN